MNCYIYVNKKFENSVPFDAMVSSVAGAFAEALYGTAGGQGFIANYLAEFPNGMLKHRGNGNNFDFILPGGKAGIRYVIEGAGLESSKEIWISIEGEVYIVDNDEVFSRYHVGSINAEWTQEDDIYMVSCSASMTYNENQEEGFAKYDFQDNTRSLRGFFLAKTTNGRQYFSARGIDLDTLETLLTYGGPRASSDVNDKKQIKMGNNILVEKQGLYNRQGVMVDTFKYLKKIYGENIDYSEYKIIGDNGNLTQIGSNLWK